ncbi:hypothetical protein [Pseudonocardia sp. DR1-2]|uniref:hypothetical protein n=1 Tax=Pseudonocardia sp. DR1-2 TaxID=2951168 RepID=UPI0027E23123|nr:hypothetical protein [Pseudonocardia sp. DR1-2]
MSYVLQRAPIRGRIDHLLTTPGLADAAHEAVVDRAPAHDRRFSDHAPVVVRLGAV